MGPDSHEWEGGRYAKRWRGRMKEYLADIREDDSNPLDLMPELEVSRIVLSMAIDRMLAGQDTRQVTVDSGEYKETRSVEDADIGDSRKVGMGGTEGLNDVIGPADIPLAEFSAFPVTENGINSDTTKVVGGKKLVDIADLQLVRECNLDIVNIVNRIIVTRNQTALTKAETMYIMAQIREAIQLFVPKDKQAAFVKFLVDRVPIEKPKEIPEEV